MVQPEGVVLYVETIGEKTKRSVLCIQVMNLSRSLCNSTGKALYAGERNIVIRHSIPEMSYGMNTVTHTQSKHSNIYIDECGVDEKVASKVQQSECKYVLWLHIKSMVL